MQIRLDNSYSIKTYIYDNDLTIVKYSAVKNYRINIIVSLFFHRGYFSFTLQSYIQKEKLLLNIFIKKCLKIRLYLNLKLDFTDQAKMAMIFEID